MNRHPARKRHIIATTLVVISFGLLDLGVFVNNKQKANALPKHICCVLDLKTHDDTTRGLVNGYNYSMLKRFAKDCGIEDCRISLAKKGDRLIDSLRNGYIDIVVMPCTNAEVYDDEVVMGSPGDSAVIWVVRPGLRKVVRNLERWIPENTDSVFINQYFNTFNNPYNVARLGIRREFLSPYDSLFKSYSAKLGWDWRLLAAVAWHESRFHIEAHSHKGASGLMQMMPGTAEYLSVDDLLDPESSIRSGAEYLAWMSRIFRRKSLNRNELVKFSLAAYNTGHGHIRDCINYAQYKDVFDGTWKSVRAIIPEMSADSIIALDTVKLGKFKGRETIGYVDSIMDIYESFKQIVPFSQDRPSK